MLKRKSFLIFLFFIFLLTSNFVSGGYWDFVTVGFGDNRWCRLFGTCEIDTLIVKNLTIDNGTVTFINKTVININVTGTMDVDGNISADNFFYADGTSINDTILWENSTGEVRLKSPQNVQIASNLTSSINTSGMEFKLNGGIKFWLYG